MCDDTHELTCRIYRLEDKLLRSRNYADQMELQSILRKLRLELSKKKKKTGEIVTRKGSDKGSFFFFVRQIYIFCYEKKNIFAGGKIYGQEIKSGRLPQRVGKATA